MFYWVVELSKGLLVQPNLKSNNNDKKKKILLRINPCGSFPFRLSGVSRNFLFLKMRPRKVPIDVFIVSSLEPG